MVTQNIGTPRKLQKELNAGTVSLVLLALLSRAREPMYGYQIAQRLGESATEGLPIKQGTVYPALRSLQVQGLLESEVEPSVSGPPRRYYTITPEGHSALTTWKEAWDRTRNWVDSILDSQPEETRA